MCLLRQWLERFCRNNIGTEHCLKHMACVGEAEEQNAKTYMVTHCKGDIVHVQDHVQCNITCSTVYLSLQ